MILHLLISTGPAGDSFIDMAEEPVCCGPEFEGSKRLDFKSTEWLESPSSEGAPDVEKLVTMVIGELEDHAVQGVWVVFLGDLCDPRTQVVLPILCKRFKYFLELPSVLRLYIVCPSASARPGFFRQRFEPLLKDLGEERNNLNEIQLILLPMKEGKQTTLWHRGHLRAYSMTNLQEEARMEHDEWLSHGSSPQYTSSSFGRCFFDQDLWRRYWVNRALYDLTLREEVDPPDHVLMNAREYVENNQIIQKIYDSSIEIPDIPELALEDNIEDVESEAPTHSLCQVFLKQSQGAYTRALDSEDTRLDVLKEKYQACLGEMVGRHPTSLTGFEEALLFHGEIINILDNLYNHFVPLEKLISRHVIEIINQMHSFVDEFSRRSASDRLDSSDWHKETILARLERIDGILEFIQMPQKKPAIFNTLTLLMQKLKVMTEVLFNLHEQSEKNQKPVNFEEFMSSTLIDKEIAQLIAQAPKDLDQEFSDLRDKGKETQESLTDLDQKSGFFKRVFSSSYRNRRRSLSEQQNKVETQYEKWGGLVNKYLELLSSYLVLSKNLQLVLEMFRKRRTCLYSAGLFLDNADQKLSKIHQEAKDKLSTIPNKSEMNKNMELLLLIREDMDELYQYLGPVHIQEYLNYLNEFMAEIPYIPGQWAAMLLGKYSDQLQLYCKGLFNTLSMVDLPMLIRYDYFKEIVHRRMVTLAHTVPRELIPLTPNINVRERYYQMIWGLPLHSQAVTNLFTAMKQDITYNREDISTIATEVTYVDNRRFSYDGSSISLDLTISLRGFTEKGYQFWSVFNP